MQMLFVDESGTPLPLEDCYELSFFVLGGVIIPEDFWHSLKNEMKIIKQKYDIEGEIKWRYFATSKTGSKPNSLSHLSQTIKENLRTDLYALINRYKSIRTICVITDMGKAYNDPRINTPDDIYWRTYKIITERFQSYLQDISRVSGQTINGIVICDHRGPRDDKRLQELHNKLLNGHEDKSSNYENLIEGIFIAPSHLSVGIQFADIVAGAILRKFKNNDDRFFNQIKDTLRTSKEGKIEGFGFARLPKE